MLPPDVGEGRGGVGFSFSLSYGRLSPSPLKINVGSKRLIAYYEPKTLFSSPGVVSQRLFDS